MKEQDQISEEDFPEYEVLSLRQTDSLGAMDRYIFTLKMKAKSRGLDKEGDIFTVFHQEPHPGTKADYEVYMPVSGPPEVLDGLPEFGGDHCLKLRHKGAYRELSQAYEVLKAAADKRGLVASGPPREVYVRGPILGFLSIIPTMVTDIYLPVKAA